MLAAEFRAGNERGYFLFFEHFPVDEFFYIRMVDIHYYHFGSTAGGATGFNRASSAVTNFKEAHKARGCAATGQVFTAAAQVGEVRTGARTIFKQACFTLP